MSTTMTYWHGLTTHIVWAINHQQTRLCHRCYGVDQWNLIDLKSNQHRFSQMRISIPFDWGVHSEYGSSTAMHNRSRPNANRIPKCRAVQNIGKFDIDGGVCSCPTTATNQKPQQHRSVVRCRRLADVCLCVYLCVCVYFFRVHNYSKWK